MQRNLLMSVGLWGTAACMTILYLGMRAVMNVGGFCAEGGAYQIAVHCPQGVALLMPLSIFVGLFCALLYAISCPPQAPNIAPLFWTALFVSLGWNFLDYGFVPLLHGAPWDISWTLCGFVFLAMGLGPVFLGIGELFGLKGQSSTNSPARWFLLLYVLLVSLGVWSGYALFTALS